MKEIQFDEGQLVNLQTLGAALFSEDDSDPRSWNYRRQLIRPKIRWVRIAIFAFLLSAGTVGIYFLLTVFSVPASIALWVCLASTIIVLLVYLQRILICLIRVYQRYAPASLRNKCRFEPSCSQYMILSLQKYGLWKGFWKGVDRLKRCNTDDGGFDYP